LLRLLPPDAQRHAEKQAGKQAKGARGNPGGRGAKIVRVSKQPTQSLAERGVDKNLAKLARRAPRRRPRAKINCAVAAPPGFTKFQNREGLLYRSTRRVFALPLRSFRELPMVQLSRELRERFYYSVPTAGAQVGWKQAESYRAAERGDIPVERAGKFLLVPKAKWDRIAKRMLRGHPPLNLDRAGATTSAT
jgi:hypothetical protein